MKDRDQSRLDALRMIKTALKNEEIQLGRALEDEGAIKVLQRLCNQRRDSIEQFEKAGRPDRAERERVELAIIESYMPKAPDDDAIRAAVKSAVESTGARDAKAMGAVMKAVMAHFAGQPVDGRKVSQMVKEALG